METRLGAREVAQQIGAGGGLVGVRLLNSQGFEHAREDFAALLV
jgi:hypothetical protein